MGGGKGRRSGKGGLDAERDVLQLRLFWEYRAEVRWVWWSRRTRKSRGWGWERKSEGRKYWKG